MSKLAPKRAEPDERLISGSVLVGPRPRRARRPLWHSVVLAAIATLLGAITLVSLGEPDDGPVSLRAENGASTTTGPGRPVRAISKAVRMVISSFSGSVTRKVCLDTGPRQLETGAS